MMIKNLMLSTLIFFIALPVFAADSIKSLPFKEKSISKAEIRSISQKIKLSCDESGAKLWVVKIAEAEKYYLINENLQMIQLSKHLGKYQIVDYWDLTRYQQVYALEEDKSGIEFIYPALYPLNRHSYAIALIHGWVSNDAGEQNAQFIQLLPKGKTKLVFEHLPFYEYQNRLSCYKDMKDKKNNYCDDQKETVLKISYRDVGLAYYEWHLSYLNINWLKNNKIDEYKQRSLTLIPFIQAQ